MGDFCRFTDPRELSREDIIEIYRKACDRKEHFKLRIRSAVDER
jgi:hypothetical protein